jgi:ectoine hydroxylase-related dioxygenase (phytanoyl-CoA dioxygenase family)
MKEFASSELSDELKVRHLKRFWQRRSSARAGWRPSPAVDDWVLDNVLLNGLGLALEETAEFLNHNRSLNEFERWARRTSGGVDPLRVERINATVAREPNSEATRAYLEEIEQIAPVLTAADLSFWDEHGYVIVRGAVDRDQARRAEIAVLAALNMKPEERASCYHHPAMKGIMTALYHHPALEANRRSPRIRKAFAQIWGTADLWMTTDRAGFNPPETDEFLFPGPRLHWDMSLVPPFELGTHGVLYLCDVAADQGAFSCIPGFHSKITEWLENLPDTVDPREEVLNYPAVPIAAEAGDLIIWHHYLPHGSSPNHNDYPRTVQYLNMYPAVFGPEKEWR